MSIHRTQRNWGCRVHEYQWYGLDAVTLENERIRVSFLVGKGTDLVEFNYKARDLDFAWLAPGGIRNPHDLVAPHRDGVGPFIESYPGGWQEIFPSAGAPAEWAGATYGQHGEAFGLPWDMTIVEDSEERVAVRFTLRGVKTPCTIEKTVALESGKQMLSIKESLTNQAPVPFEAMWGHHITFGAPFLVPGCKIRLPDGIAARPHGDAVEAGARRVGSPDPFAWPNGTGIDGDTVDFSIVPESGTSSELFYLSGFGDTGSYEIMRPDVGTGMRVHWDAKTLPYLWYWQEFGGTQSWPWWGRNFNIGLEPNSSYPTSGLPEAVANGSALTLRPGETKTLWLEATILDGSSK